VVFEKDGKQLTWWGDNKQRATFIRTESDFTNFVEILAKTHNLFVRKDENRRRPHGWPAYVFR
jgi:hypothetical protein